MGVSGNSPGKGLTLKYFDRSKITKVYGVEPNTAMHPALRAEIERCKLSDIYTIVCTYPLVPINAFPVEFLTTSGSLWCGTTPQ